MEKFELFLRGLIVHWILPADFIDIPPQFALLSSQDDTTAVGAGGESGVAGKKSSETVRATDRLIEALELARDEFSKWNEYIQDSEDAERDFKRAKSDGNTGAVRVDIVPPSKNPMLLNLTPSM